jgi:hypothetical protein
MQILIGQGSITTLSTVDASAYGTIPADNANALVKTGINAFGTTGFTLTAPGVSGQSINYLVEAQFIEADGSPIALPYYNSSNPSQPFTGPANSQALQNTVRTQRVGLQLKAGAPASAGTQQTPAVDAGWTGLYFITVNFAQTTVTATSISVYPGAPFIGTKIPGLAPLASPALTGTGTSPTPPINDSSTRIATTAFVTSFGHIPTMQTITSSQNFTVPAGVTRVRARVWGAGGGGGYAQGNAAGGGGGGGGGYAEGAYSVTPGAVIFVGVGPGGNIGTSSSFPNGTAGGASAFGAFCSAAGGQPGFGAQNALAITGAPGGIATGGALNVTGGAGYFPYATGSLIKGGSGGCSFGTGNTEGPGNSIGLGSASPGSGGSGAATQTTSASSFIGGPGSNGLVLLEW